MAALCTALLEGRIYGCLTIFRTMHCAYVWVLSEHQLPQACVAANEPPLELRWTKLCLQYALKLGSNQLNPTINVVFNAKFKCFFERKPRQIPPLSFRVSCDLKDVGFQKRNVLSSNTVSRWSRRDAVIIDRLHLGHTGLTHSYLLSGTDQPECSACHCPLGLTVKHIPIECPAWTSTRSKHFTDSSVKDLFLIMLLPETLSILSKNPIFIALYNVVTTYFILA